MSTSERIYSKAKKTIFWRDSSSAHHREYILNPKKLYFGATHQKHIIENISLIQTNNILARITRSTSPRIFSKSKPCCNLIVLVLVLILGTSHHQADACHLASVYLGFRSIWNTHFCLRLQPHLYPSLVATSLGRDVRPNSDISQRMSSPTPPSETRNYC